VFGGHATELHEQALFALQAVSFALFAAQGSATSAAASCGLAGVECSVDVSDDD
jgi:hypothetical protein